MHAARNRAATGQELDEQWYNGDMQSSDALAQAMFSQADTTSVWDDGMFNAWLAVAGLAAWGQLESHWQSAGCPPSFSWDVLRKGVEKTSATFCSPPLETLGAFLYPQDHRLGYEGYWLDWQTPEVQQEVYRTAQAWLEKADVGLGDQSWMLLNIARDSGCMKAWREAPDKCVEHLDWNKGMYGLNAMEAKDLTVADIERVPPHGVPDVVWQSSNPHVAAMLKCYQSNWRSVARCLETKAGPGLWLQYVLESPPKNLDGRRMTAWENMHLLGVDAWALVQLYRPSGSFELSLESGLDGYKALEPYKQWAQQWWVQCVLGMETEQALEMARTVRASVCLEETMQVDSSLFSNDEPVVS